MSRTSGSGGGVYTTAINNKPLKKKIIADYLEMENPPLLKPWLKEHHMMKRTFDTLHGELIAEAEARTQVIVALENAKKRAAVNKLGEGLDDEQAKWENVEKAIYQKALGGTVSAQELFAKLKGRLVEQHEVKIGLSADEIARRNLAAERELQAGHRVEEVQKEPSLLSN